MKLICVTPSYWPAFQYGGPIASVHGLNKALVKKGVDVTVYTTNVGLDGKVAVLLIRRLMLMGLRFSILSLQSYLSL